MAVGAGVMIAVSPDAVWEALADFGAIERWSPVVVESHLTGDVAEGVGCARHCELFPRGSVDEVVTIWEPGEHLGISVESQGGGPFSSQHSDFSIAAAADGCTVTMTMEFELAAGAEDRLASITGALQQAVDATTAGLRYHVETGDSVGTEVPPTA